MSEVLRCYIGLLTCTILLTISIILLIFKPKHVMQWLDKHHRAAIITAALLAVLGRYASVLAYFGVPKYVHDFDVFLMWSNTMLDEGIKGFMTEYPAGYLYILTGLRGLQRAIGLGDNYIVSTLVLKSPSILAEVLLGMLAYKWAAKRVDGGRAVLLACLVLFSPAYVLNSGMWGQADGMLILMVVLSLYYLDADNRLFAALFYTGACLVKAQAIFFAPVFGMFYIMPLLKRDGNVKILRDYIVPLVSCVAVFSLLTLPFKENATDLWLVSFMKHISVEHPSNTMAALNLFGLHGGNAIPYTNNFLFLDYRTWGYIFIAMICIACVIFSLKRKPRSIFILSAFCMGSIFTLGVSMHERYILPVIALLVLAYLYDRDINKIILSFLYSILAFINQSMILFDLFGGNTSSFKLMSGISVAIFVYLIVVTVCSIYKKAGINTGREHNLL